MAFFLANPVSSLLGILLLAVSIYAGVQHLEVKSLRNDLASLENKLEKQKIEAQELLAQKTAEVAKINADNAAKSLEIEAQHAKALAALKSVPVKQLRDPAGCGQSRTGPVSEPSPTPSISPVPADSGYLSESLSRLLQSEAKRADEVAVYANSCFQYVKSLGESYERPNQ